MKLRKILSVLLCVAAVISVMAIVALNAQATEASAEDPSGNTTTTATTVTTTAAKGVIEQIGDWWADFYPNFDAIYKVGFNWVSQILVWAFQFLLNITGLNLWTGGSFGIF